VTVAGLQEIQVSADADRSRGLERETDAVRDTLGALGRTEDVRLAPGGKRLVIACYALDRIAVADVVLDSSQVRIERLELLPSPALGEPHGVDFVDEETIVVAGRQGGLGVFRLPAPDARPRHGRSLRCTRSKLLIVTSESTPLAFFDVAGTVDHPWDAGRDEAALLRSELHALAVRDEVSTAARASEAGLRAQVDAIEHSLTWRLTEPARGVYRSVRRLASR
jgi:hypothetical protein